MIWKPRKMLAMARMTVPYPNPQCTRFQYSLAGAPLPGFTMGVSICTAAADTAPFPGGVIGCLSPRRKGVLQRRGRHEGSALLEKVIPVLYCETGTVL